MWACNIVARAQYLVENRARMRRKRGRRRRRTVGLVDSYKLETKTGGFVQSGGGFVQFWRFYAIFCSLKIFKYSPDRLVLEVKVVCIIDPNGPSNKSYQFWGAQDKLYNAQEGSYHIATLLSLNSGGFVILTLHQVAWKHINLCTQVKSQTNAQVVRRHSL